MIFINPAWAMGMDRVMHTITDTRMGMGTEVKRRTDRGITMSKECNNS
jgi:hypothetical protein